MKTPNRLLKASSPYLLQHAYNPIDWYEWGEEALKRAKEEDKPILVSIGYSACHWCHVMERESFENDSIAELMNQNFVCIKIDREERPDIDQIYMEAVQLMGVGGGWPLNVMLLPDGRPFYGGTYFPPENWTNLLTAVSKAYKEKRGELEASADELSQGIARSEVQRYGLDKPNSDFSTEKLQGMFQKLSTKFDTVRGGMNRAPKFPMPSIYSFLMRYYHATQDEAALRQLKTTLDQMAFGGIYDQVGGGFSRYSVDADWLVPHFEKMLYDNAQLISVYAEAYSLTGLERYKEVVYQSIEFLEREMSHNSGGFYAALDADSEGVEGKFYIWQVEELKQLISTEDYALFADYYQVSKKGNWEEGNNILHKKLSNTSFAEKHDISTSDLALKVGEWQRVLLKVRTGRIRPGLDDKILTSWNGLTLTALAKAYAVFGEEKFLKMALKNAKFLSEKMMKDNGQLSRNYKEGKVSIQAYLEDYATVTEGFIQLYQVTFDTQWLRKADKLTNYAIQNFEDKEEGLFFFTDITGEKLIARKKEVFDNVIPASNSIMARNLHTLGLLLDKSEYTEKAKNMLAQTSKLLGEEVHYLTNWACLYTDLLSPTAEVAIVGKELEVFAQELQTNFLPNTLFVGTKIASDELPLLANRQAIGGKTTIYVCRNKACKLPVYSAKEALEEVRN